MDKFIENMFMSKVKEEIRRDFKSLQDKLDKIEKYVRIFTDEENEDITFDELLHILQIIKGVDELEREINR
jgi:hypothetical protein